MRTFPKIITAVTLGVIGQLAMKAGMNQVGEISRFSLDIFPRLLNFWVIFGLVAYGFAMLIWLMVLAESDLSYAYPMLSLGYILIAFFSYLLFKDSITIPRWIGIFTICFGVWLVSNK